MDSQSAAPLPSDLDSRRRGHALQVGRGNESLFLHVSNPNPTPEHPPGTLAWPSCPPAPEVFLHWFNEYTIQRPH